MVYDIKYAGGCMTLDLRPFIDKKTITDARFFARKVVGISFDRARIAAEMIADMEIYKEDQRHELQRMMDSGRYTKTAMERLARTIKKYDRFIEALREIA